MIQELIYTSVPRGLKPGTQGFCTVACTMGMPPHLAARLESLSGYRAIYPPNDSNASKNPVVFSHLVLNIGSNIGGAFQHVLSRTSDAGLDYTQRANKISHHLAFDVTECVDAGPASLLLQPGLFQAVWTQKPAFLPPDKQFPHFASPPRVCVHWQRLTGDAGWGAVLAETVQNQRPVSLIFSPGTELLPLFDEALALLPPELRWKTTFTTYYCHQPAETHCQWKGILTDSPEMSQARLSANTLVIDLTRPLPAPNASASLLELARNGTLASSLQDKIMPTTYDLEIVSHPETMILPEASHVFKGNAIPIPRKTVEVPLKEKSRFDVSHPFGIASRFFWMIAIIVFFAAFAAAFFMVGVLSLALFRNDSTPNRQKDIAAKQPESLGAGPLVILETLPDWPGEISHLDYWGKAEILKNKPVFFESYWGNCTTIPFYFFADDRERARFLSLPTLFLRGGTEYFGTEKYSIGQKIVADSGSVLFAFSDETGLHLFEQPAKLAESEEREQTKDMQNPTLEQQPERQSERSFFFSEIQVGDRFFAIFPTLKYPTITKKFADFDGKQTVLIDYCETLLDDLRKFDQTDRLTADMRITLAASSQAVPAPMNEIVCRVGESKRENQQIILSCRCLIRETDTLLMTFEIVWDLETSQILFANPQYYQNKNPALSKNDFDQIEWKLDIDLGMKHPNPGINRKIKLLTTAEKEQGVAQK